MKLNISERENLRTWIEINRKALKSNYAVFRKILGKGTLLMSVVKSNAYGHGLVDFSKEVERLGVDWFGVDSIVEGNTLRQAKIKKPIFVLGYVLPARIPEAIKNNISITISDFENLKFLRNSKRSMKGLRVHIKVDTGMHRQGFYIAELPKVIDMLKALPITVEGVYTHFSSAKDPNDTVETEQQLKKFNTAVKIFEDAGYKNLIRHAGATGGSIVFTDSHFDMVRVGIGLYGIWPSHASEQFYKKKITLLPVLTWKTIVSQIKLVQKGEGIGYDLTEKVNHDATIAILPIGYWHGFPRSLSGVGEVLIKGKRVKVLGRVSMDMIVVDVSQIGNIQVGDEAVLIGKSKNGSILAEDMAEKCGTTAYEIVTRINPLIRRIVA